MPVLSQEVSPAVYMPGSNEYSSPLRDEYIADLAGMTVRQMAEVDGRHWEGMETETMVLPTKMDHMPVLVHRVGNTVKIPGVRTSPRGGTRLYDSGSPNEVRGLGDGMDTKFNIHMKYLVELGVVDPEKELPVGGKSEIVVPVPIRSLTSEQKANIIIEFARALDDEGFFFERNHRTGPDMNMNPDDMALVRDTLLGSGYSLQQANSWITGKPVPAGGVAGRLVSTPRGGATVADEYFKLLGVPEGTRVRFALHGYGNAGEPLVDQFNLVSSYGGELASVSDLTGTVTSRNGIDTAKFKALLFQRNREGDIKYQTVMKAGTFYRQEVDPDARVTSYLEDKDAWLDVDADVFVPASVAGVINSDNVKRLIKNINPGATKFVFSLANHGVSTPAQVELERHGVRTTHHAHFNSHGVVASLVESAFAAGKFADQDPASPDTVNKTIDVIARRITRELFDLSNSGNLTQTTSLAVAAEAIRIANLQKRFE